MRILGIPVTPPLYYLMRMPIAQVELMAADVSMTTTPKRKKNLKKGEFNKPASWKLHKAARMWNPETDGGNGKKVAIDLSDYQI